MADQSPPFVSIILPLYNACKTNPDYLLEALKSLARQSCPYFELIVVDDGSTDDSARIYQNFISKHPEMEAYYYYKKNGGQSSAGNFGGELSKGNFLSFIDQDGLFYENTLELGIRQLETDPDLIYTDVDISHLF
jgi:glycosyltransferase involved in cell wall biosynthesis